MARHTEEANHVELDLAKRGNHDANNNQNHVGKGLEVDLRDSKHPGGEKSRDGGSGLVIN